jgi:hypothetical protein
LSMTLGARRWLISKTSWETINRVNILIISFIS